MSEFEALWTSVEPLLDDHFGESFLVEPRIKADPNGRGAADTTRLARTITGIWSEPPIRDAPVNRTGHRSAEGGRFDSTKPSIDFETSALPYDLLIGDFVTRIKTGVRYTVADPTADGFSRSTAQLTSLRGRPA